MRNPYKIHSGESSFRTAIDAIIFPGAYLSHIHQINVARESPLIRKIKNYSEAVLVEVMKLGVLAAGIHTTYEALEKYLIN